MLQKNNLIKDMFPPQSPSLRGMSAMQTGGVRRAGAKIAFYRRINEFRKF